MVALERHAEAHAEEPPFIKHQRQIYSSDMASPCIFFARGACSRGKDCRFTHEAQKRQLRGDAHVFTPRSTFGSAQSPSSAAPDRAKSSPICHFYLQGRCMNGVICKFRHPELTQQIDRPEVREAQDQAEADIIQV